jgi:hypothetical protein
MTVRLQVACYYLTYALDYVPPQWMCEKEMGLMDVLPALKMVEFEALIPLHMPHDNREASIADKWVVKEV